MNPEAYVKAWNQLRKHLEDKAARMPDGTTIKTATLAILFQMDILEPETSSEDGE